MTDDDLIADARARTAANADQALAAAFEPDVMEAIVRLRALLDDMLDRLPDDSGYGLVLGVVASHVIERARGR